MKFLASLAALALLAIGFASPALAQSQSVGGVAVSVCGAAPNSPVVGYPYFFTEDLFDRLCTQASPTAPAAIAAVAGSQIAKASGGTLYSFDVVSGASAGFVLVFNSATVPADGAVTPVECYSIAANSTLKVQEAQPLYLANGVVIVFSTTGCYTKTISATAFISSQVQ